MHCVIPVEDRIRLDIRGVLHSSLTGSSCERMVTSVPQLLLPHLQAEFDRVL